MLKYTLVCPSVRPSIRLPVLARTWLLSPHLALSLCLPQAWDLPSSVLMRPDSSEEAFGRKNKKHSRGVGGGFLRRGSCFGSSRGWWEQGWWGS